MSDTVNTKILYDNGTIIEYVDGYPGRPITDLYISTLGHSSGDTYNIILDCEKY